MRTRLRIVVLIAALLMVSGTGLACWRLLTSGVTVSVINATGGEVTNVQIEFTGGSKSFPKLKFGESLEIRVNPDGESDLVVRFADSSGKQFSANDIVYFEHNYRGTIHITIGPDGKVTSKDMTTGPLF